MAIALEDKPNVDPPSASYPNGNIRDNPGDGSGTPVNKLVYADLHQFFARLLAESGIVPNGQPENAYDGFQYIQAIKKLFIGNGGSSTTKMKTVPIGVWNMSLTLNVTIASGIAFNKLRGILNVSIMRDDGSFLDQGPNGVSSTSTGGTEMFFSISNTGGLFVERKPGGDYDGAAYSSTLINRGYITFLYEE